MGKRLLKSHAKRNIPICAAAVLFCLTLLSLYSVTGVFARYTTSVQTSDQARVARFSINSGFLQDSGSTLSASIEANLTPGGEIPATIIIENKSEVAVEYTIAVKNATNNLPLSFRMEKVGGSPNLSGTGTTFTAQQVPGSHDDRYTLYIEWQKAGDTEEDQKAKEAELALMGMVDLITVTVTAAQVD